MSKAQDLIKEFVTVTDDPKKAVAEVMAKTGKKAVGCFPVFTPDEIVYAAGMLPVGLWGGQVESVAATKYLQSFCCSIMKANMEQGLTGVYDMLSAVITTTYCDTLKCIEEVWKAAVPSIRNVPFVCAQNRKTEGAQVYLVTEFNRIKKEMEEISGNTITDADMEESIKVYNRYRAAARKFTEVARDYPLTITPVVRHQVIKAAYFMDKKDYAEKLEELVKELQAMPKEDSDLKGVVLTGLIAEPNAFLELFNENGLNIVGDDLVHESRQFTEDVPDGSEAPFVRMAKRIASINGCSLLYDENKSRGERIANLVKETGAEGVVVCQLKFCDPEEFDYPIYKKELQAKNIPLLYLEIEQRMDSAEQMRTRIQTFSEVLG